MNTTDISRGKNNPISQIAFKENVSTREVDRQKVFQLINSQRNTHEIAEIMGKEIHQISGRFTELKKGKITPIGFSFYKGKRGTIYAKNELF